MSESNPRSVLTRPQVRKVLAKADQIQKARPEVRDLAMIIAGTSTVPDLVAHALVPRSKNTAVIDHLANIDGLDPVEAVVETLELGKDQMRELWRLLGALGHAGERMNASDAKAAAAIVKAIKAMPDEDRYALLAATQLLTEGRSRRG